MFLFVIFVVRVHFSSAQSLRAVWTYQSNAGGQLVSKQYDTIQNDTITTLQYNTMQYNNYKTMQYDTIQYHIGFPECNKP